MYITELVKQELRFRKQFSCNTVRYKNSQGEITYNTETKTIYYKGNNRQYKEFLGTVAI